jgi:hypothetical protein
VPEPKDIGQGTEGKELTGIFKESSITNLGMTPKAFKNMKGMLSESSHPALSAVL